MADKRKAFLVGKAGKTEVRKLLRKTTDPAVTIQAFQRTHSLHTMFSRAFSTTPKYEMKEEGDTNNDGGPDVEALDTDSVLMFLNHLGVPQHEVHKRIADALKGSLEDEIRKVKGTQPLLNLLKSCWPYSTTVPELRPVLWAVLRQLGDNTPIPVLELLGERGPGGEGLKHAEVWHPLPPLLKRLVWEADWDKYVTNAKADPTDPKEYLQLVQSTLFAEQLKPWIEQYVTQNVLQEAANKPFVSSQRERRLMTTQRRALTSTVSAAVTTAAAAAIKKDVKKDAKQQQFEDGLTQTSKAVTELRKLLSSAESPAYRPKLLYAIFSILMARHGTSAMFLGGSDHLYCTLVADILLSSKVPKDYLPLKSLAQTLDETIKIGAMTDKNICAIQASLRQIFPEEETSGSAAASSSETKTASAMKTPKVHSSEMKALLKRVIASGIAAMKEADPQSLFLNPVTDAIAPGYSKVIQKPMCMKQMEDAGYLVIEDWNRDVQLMFRNCIAYNSGNDGQWFRGEARRQNKVYKDDIYTQAKKLFETESAKILPPPEVQKKRKASGAGEVQPLEPVSSKKRKKVDDPYLPSMEALASMLLSDPFVIRLMMDRILRSLRIDTLKGSTLPTAHTLVPSLLQLLNLAQLSKQLCALRGKEYMVPGIGLVPDKGDPVPFKALREYTPLLLKLFLEADLDKRMAGVELQAAAQSLPERTNVIALESWRTNKQMAGRLHMLRALVEGALVHVCQPGNSFENSLAHTFPKFADALNQLASPNLWEELPFFQSLIQAILRHKSKLSKGTRDTIVSTWINWLQVSAKKKGAMFSAAHECFMTLISEWASLGNLLLPRDVLMKVTQEAIEAVNASEKTEDRKFVNVWKEAPEAFVPIKELYERVLKTLPEAQAKEWKDAVGIQEEEEADVAEEPTGENMEVEAAEEEAGETMEE